MAGSSEFLSCGQHACPQRCHILMDHSKMPCRTIVTDLCPQKHKLSWECCNGQKPACQECRVIDEQRRERAKRVKALEDARQAKQHAYAKQLKQLQDQIVHQQQLAKDRQDDALRDSTLEQQRKELARLVEEAKKPSNPVRPTTTTVAPVAQPPKPDITSENTPAHNGSTVGEIRSDHSKETEEPQSKATECDADVTGAGDQPEEMDMPFEKHISVSEQDWCHQKTFENASNESLDSLMSMVGLESVKQECLRIKAKVDTVIRQGASLNEERFSAALLGNPGTGKPSVSREKLR